jgi:hypothetical protein
MIQNLVALGNCLKSGSNRGTGIGWDGALIAIGCTSSGGAGIPTEAYSIDYVL